MGGSRVPAAWVIPLRAPASLGNIPTPASTRSLAALVFAAQSPYSDRKNVANGRERYEKIWPKFMGN
jgi:hypothetical protein